MNTQPPPEIGGFDCVSAAWRAHEGELRSDLRHRASDIEGANDLQQAHSGRLRCRAEKIRGPSGSDQP